MANCTFNQSSKMSSLTSLEGQDWVKVVANLREPRSSEDDRSIDDGLEVLPNGVKNTSETMKLKKEDMYLYGLCPAWDEFYLVVCEYCGRVIKPQSLERHIELRHSVAAFESTMDTPPTSTRSEGSSSLGSISAICVQPSSSSSNTCDNNNGSGPNSIDSDGELGLKKIRTFIPTPPGPGPGCGGFSNLASRGHTSITITQDGSTSVSNDLNNVKPVISVNEGGEGSSCSSSLSSSSKSSLLSQKQVNVSSRSLIKDEGKNQIDEGMMLVNLEKVSFSDVAKCKPKIINDINETQKIKKLKMDSSVISEAQKISLTVNQSSSSPAATIVTACTTSTTTTTTVSNTVPATSIPISTTSTSSSKPKTSTGRNKLLPCKDREYDCDKHCGVKTSEMDKACTRSLTCKTHSLTLRRKVEGRSKAFDDLLADHRAATAEKLRREGKVIKLTKQQRKQQEMEEKKKQQEEAKRLRESVKHNQPVVTLERINLPKNYLINAEPIHGPDGNLFLTSHPKPLAICTFNGRKLPINCKKWSSPVFHRRNQLTVASLDNLLTNKSRKSLFHHSPSLSSLLSTTPCRNSIHRNEINCTTISGTLTDSSSISMDSPDILSPGYGSIGGAFPPINKLSPTSTGSKGGSCGKKKKCFSNIGTAGFTAPPPPPIISSPSPSSFSSLSSPSTPLKGSGIQRPSLEAVQHKTLNELLSTTVENQNNSKSILLNGNHCRNITSNISTTTNSSGNNSSNSFPNTGGHKSKEISLEPGFT